MANRRDLCAVVSDFNTRNFTALLAQDEERPLLGAVEGPYGQVLPPLVDAGADCWGERPDFALVWTRPEAVIPSFGRRLAHEEVALEDLLREVDEFSAHLARLQDRVRAVFVPTWVLPCHCRGLGMLDMRPGQGIAHALVQMNLRLAERLQDTRNVFVLDAARWVQGAGPGAFSPKLWYMAKVPFSNQVFEEAVLDLKAAVRGLGGEARKLVVVDLDDTLWGGIVGEAGWENLRLGGHDPVGEAYADFQRALKALTNRGVLLAIVSKNEEHVALDAIRNHPEMVLREEDFAGWRINWHDKARNIAELVAELNLGLQSVVFLDDSPAERARVAEATPEVLVPDWPRDPMLYCQALAGLRVFDTPALNTEDRGRAKMYASERQRRRLQDELPTLDEWLRSLDVVATVEELSRANLPRAAQLLNKTNQWNLATRRMTETELWGWVAGPGRRLWTFRVVDRFGDSGLCGLASLEIDGKSARIVDLLMSCRVMGRHLEMAMLHTATALACSAGVEVVRLTYRPTERNAPCLRFLESCGLTRDAEGTFTWQERRPYPAPEAITIVHSTPGPGASRAAA